jgi:hypothetical protein
MTTGTTAPGPTAVGQHLTAIASSLSARGLISHLTRSGGTPVLTVDAPGGGPDPAAIAIHPDPYADSGSGPGTWLDCTCTWTPAPGASPQATAAVIAAVLNATRLGSVGPGCYQPVPADAIRLADFLCRHPGWSAFWDRRYGLWRAAEDDPASVLYAETSDLDAVMTYIVSHS